MHDYLKAQVKCPIDDVSVIAEQLVKVICATLKIKEPKTKTSFKAKVLKGASEKLALWLQQYLQPSRKEEKHVEMQEDASSYDTASIPSGAYPIEDYFIYKETFKTDEDEYAGAEDKLEEESPEEEIVDEDFEQKREEMEAVIEDILYSLAPFGKFLKYLEGFF